MQTSCITDFGKNVPGDRKLKWAQTLRPRRFHEPNVVAYGKHNTLQYGTYLTYRAIRGFEHIFEPQIRITVFIDYIHNYTSSHSPILTYQITNHLIPLRRSQFLTLNIFPRFMEPKYTKVLKKTRPFSLSPTRSFQSKSQSYFLNILFNVILPSTYIFLPASDTVFDTETAYIPLLCPRSNTTSASVIVTCG
jgi:hypothetical protein